MAEICATTDVWLTKQIDTVLRRNRAVQARPSYRSPEAQKVSNLLCDQLDALFRGELQPDRGSD